jgi:signal transduction histidine kinase
MSSVRTQLILWNVAILTLILLACGTAVRFKMEDGLIATIDRELVDRVKPAIGDIPPGGIRPGPPNGPMGQRQGQPPNGRPPARPGAFGGPGPGSMQFADGPAQGQNGMPPGPGPGGYGMPPGPGQGGYGMPPGAGMPPQRGMRGGPPPMNAPENDGDQPQGAPPPPTQRQGRPDVRVFDRTGASLRGDAPFSRDAFDASLGGESVYRTIVQNGTRYRVYSTPKENDGAVIAIVQSEESLAPVDSEVSDLNVALLTMIPIGLVAAALGAGFLTIRSLRPVDQIAAAVGRIQAEDLSRRLPINGRDEFARLGSTLNAMLARLQSSFEEQRRFTMDASHELKTPLTVIKAKTSVALTRERTPEAYQSTLQTVERAADQMTRIVQDLLLLAQADSGQLGADRTPVSVRYVIDSALDGVFPDEGPSITVDIPEPAPAVTGNSSQLARVFRNLIENAVRYTPVTGKVHVCAQRAAAGVEIVVGDTGEGIAPEHLAKLGTRFYRVDTARTREKGGTGLGLAICKGIIEAHGGRMRFESRVGQGTTVHVFLPSH